MDPVFSPARYINDARQRWLFRMVHTRRPLQEKMALFWHQHFATAYSKIANAVGGEGATQMMAAKRSEHPAGLWSQLELFRDYALPNFRDLLIEVAKDPAMLFWLDGRLNTRARPQENFAREVMELFTIGIGQLSESDVYAGARVFTGWNLQRIGDGRDPLGLLSVLLQRRAARHEREDVHVPDLPRWLENDSSEGRVCRDAGWNRPARRHSPAILPPGGGSRKRCGRFSSARLEPPEEVFVSRIAKVYADSDCHMSPVVRAVLSSREFDAARRAISPGTRGLSSSSLAR